MFIMAKHSIKTAVVKTKYGPFKAVFEPEIDMGGYVATAPNVQGVVSWGKNLAHAKEMVTEAIELVIETRAIENAEKEGYIRVVYRNKPTPVA